MTQSLSQSGQKMGRDAMHRARVLVTHPTHACSKRLCGFDEMPKASRLLSIVRNNAILPFLAMADSIALGADR
jgi:hypothetical protein